MTPEQLAILIGAIAGAPFLKVALEWLRDRQINKAKAKKIEAEAGHIMAESEKLCDEGTADAGNMLVSGMAQFTTLVKYQGEELKRLRGEHQECERRDEESRKRIKQLENDMNALMKRT